MLISVLDGTPVEQLKPSSERKVLVRCDSCGKENQTTYHNYRLSQEKFGRNGETFCRKCASIASGKAKRGKSIKREAPSPTGPEHWGWKGGKFIASDGYVQVYLGPRKYRKEHFLVMEEALGRRLAPVEVVHHIDGNKQNNKLDNLVRLVNESHHQRVHNSLYKLSLDLVRAGLIQFDRESTEYMAMDKLRELLEQPEEANQQPSSDSNVLEGSTTR
jgi:hypothetical protein